MLQKESSFFFKAAENSAIWKYNLFNQFPIDEHLTVTIK